MKTPRRDVAVPRRAVGLAVLLLVLGALPGAAQQGRTLSSWTSDRADLAVGDVVTILVDEYVLASANTDKLEAKGHIRDIGVTGGTAGGRMGGGVRTTNDLEDSRYGEASRHDRFRAEISARVVEVSAGAVRIEGTKTLQVDENEQEVTISGWIRPQDVTSSNTVDSWRIADARVAYGSNGELGKTGGFWSTILDLLIP